MAATKKGTAPVTSVGADGEQSLDKNSLNIIAESPPEGNLQATNNKCLEAISMNEIYDTAYPPKVPIIDDFLYAGTYLFVGAPKLGKSFFMAQIGYHICMGIPLWNYEVRQGSVLYLALEDDYSRIQSRLNRMFGFESADNFFFATRADSLNNGLEQELHNFIKEHPDLRLVIIDTLQKVREVGNDKCSYANDYEIVTKLKELSDKYGICLLVVHHTRKMESSDSFDMISGTNGLLGAADGAFVMTKEKRTENKAFLEIAGRDQQDQRLELEFQRDTCKWKLIKAETELWKTPPDPILELVAGVVSDEQPCWEGTASELLQLIPEIDMKPNVFTRKLNGGTSKLYCDYNVSYTNDHKHEGRKIYLKKVIC